MHCWPGAQCLMHRHANNLVLEIQHVVSNTSGKAHLQFEVASKLQLRVILLTTTQPYYHRLQVDIFNKNSSNTD
jgi:hypothetical protein